ncbi:thioesterase family protein [Pseudomonas sp. KNUC1026]|uniref:thioesterase family protein n=1 Tax=Pseudomonas sp. KNUC1026 TaxID=2893890 RepID=UPI001F41AB83|nr:thioesterase family protein [Pseudomonas sp. KNUC1026]UFH48906.1 thioesterase family protein [Pseudomonas sp. KNUC1026]
MPEPLITWHGEVPSEWTDYNGHLRDAFYLLIFSYATDGFMEHIGLGEAQRETSGHSLFTLECHLNFLHEVHQGAEVAVHTQLLACDHKRVQLYHSLHIKGETLTLAASEQMLLHVALDGPKAVPFQDSMAAHLADLARQHSKGPKPEWTGRMIGMPKAIK